jgi:beta-glucanase (GH16 family)
MIYSRYRFKYGYFEIKFKLPSLPTTPNTYNGVGPNFWLYGSDASLNNYWSEIDIYEIHGNSNTLTNALHYQIDTNHTHHVDGYSYGVISGDTWHTAGAHWRPDGIDFYVDRQYVRSITNSNVKPDSMVKMPIWVDINVPPYGWNEYFDNSTVFPYVYEIDYVKVWQQKDACATDLFYCSNFNPSTFNSQNYNSVTIGGSTCTDTVTNAANLGIYGDSHVTLDEGFSIDANSKVLIDSRPCHQSYWGGRIMPGSDIFSPPSSWKAHLTK